MRGYAETGCCRRVFLLSYFGEYLPCACENCDRCAAAAQLDYVSVEEPALPVDTGRAAPRVGIRRGDRRRSRTDHCAVREIRLPDLSIAAVREHGLLDVTDPVAEPA